jgi:putative oxidoreductase
MVDSGKLQEVTQDLLRIMAGFLFAPHGAQKLFGVLGKEPVEIVSLSGLAGVLEFFGGIALILGIFTRQVAFVLAGQMAAAYWMAHGMETFWPILNRGELAALYCFVFLFLFAHGGGEFSVDGWLRRRR